MAQADNYKLAASPLTGTVYISKISKKYPNCMTSDRRKVDESEFIIAILEWAKHKKDNKDHIVTITSDGKPYAEIKLFPENF